MSRTTRPRRGRPPLAWLTPDQIRTLTTGTPLIIETHGRNGPQLVGRIHTMTEHSLEVIDAHGATTTISLVKLKRARTTDALFEPGDPVLRRGVSAAVWRGGVVRAEGSDVLVEQLDGTFAWLTEDDLEPVRPEPLPTLKRGPVPTRTL